MRSSARTANALPAYVAYQGDGDVTAPLVYVNYGMKEDYDTLERLGVSVKGKIVIARYGAGWRGLKPKLAQEHGAVGCIIYSDPRDDGYSAEDEYPKGPARPPHGIQRGSVADMTLYPGDPLTPGIGATENAQRLAIKDSPVILKIPVLPVSYADAQHFLAALDGRVVPPQWRGSLPITYHVGGGAAKAHLAVKSDWGLKPIYDVVAMIPGSSDPDQWIMRGNHHDGWVFGAEDPISGQVALLAEAKAIGTLVKQGWRPKRTLVYLSWDAEEPMLLGSTEWAEEHADELKQKGLIYINTDGTSRGFLNAEGSHSLQHVINQVAAEVTDPETGASMLARKRAQLEVLGTNPGASEEAKETRENRGRSRRATFRSGRLGRGRIIRPSCSISGCRRSIWPMAARLTSAASIIRPMTRTNITRGLPIPDCAIRMRWRKPPDVWCCALPMSRRRRSAMAISRTRSGIISTR